MSGENVTNSLETAPKPLLPSGGTDEGGVSEELRRFHLAGPQPEDNPEEEEEDKLDPELLPAVFGPFRDPETVESEYPVFLLPDEGRCLSLCELGPGERPEGTKELDSGKGAVLALLRHAIMAGRGQVRAALAEEADKLRSGLQALLSADDQKQPGTGGKQAFEGAMGPLGERLLDAEVLAKTVGPVRGTETMTPERRQRVEATIEVLQRAAEAAKADAEILPSLLHNGSLLAEEEPELPGWRVLVDGDPCNAAAQLLDQAASELTRTLGALRTAQLEVESHYDPERHDPVLGSLDWRSLGAEELLLLPPLVVALTAEQLAQADLAALTGLLRSGRPIQVLVLASPASYPGLAEGPPALRSFRFETGYLGLSQRTAFVQQGSAVKPRHLSEGFWRSTKARCPALHVVDPGYWNTAAAAVEGRAHPLFLYDPSSGEGLARRFGIEENPAPEQDWPGFELPVRKESGGEETLTLCFTFADFALMEPVFRQQFKEIPLSVGDAELVSVPDWLALPAEEATRKIPFIWAVDKESQLHRLAITRRLGLACRDRLGYWRCLQELAGVRNEHVERARAKAREEAEAQAAGERDQLLRQQREEIEQLVREAGAETVASLTGSLLQIDPAALAAAPAPTPTPTPAPAPAAETGLLDSLRSKSVEEVTTTLLQLLDLESLATEPAGQGAPPTSELAAELLRLVEGNGLNADV